MAARRRDDLGRVTAALAVLGVIAVGLTAWLSNTDKRSVVVAGLVAAAVVTAAAVPVQLMLGGKRQRRAVLTRRAAGAIRGKLPRLGEISLDVLGVRTPREASGRPRKQTIYAGRHTLDPALFDAITKYRFVLIYGPSAAGKSRSAAEAARRLWPQRPVLVPYRQQGALAELVDAGVSPETVVWLDDLDRHLDAGVDAGLIRRLLDTGDVRIIATMRAAAYETVKPGRLRAIGADVVDLAHQEEFTEWDQQDRDQASSLLAGQPGEADVVAALQRGTGLGGYLSAVPDLIERLEKGTPLPEGVAVVRAAADCFEIERSWRPFLRAYRPDRALGLSCRILASGAFLQQLRQRPRQARGRKVGQTMTARRRAVIGSVPVHVRGDRSSPSVNCRGLR